LERLLFVAALVVVAPRAAHAQETPSDAPPSDIDSGARAHFQSGSAYFDTADYDSALREFTRAYELSHRAPLLYNISVTHERMGDLREAVHYLERYLAEAENVRDRGTLEIKLRNLRDRVAHGDTGASRSTATSSSGAATPAEGSGGVPIAALIAYGAGAAGLVAFGVFGALALSEDASLGETCGADTTRTCSDDEVSNLATFSLIADIGLGVGVVGAALGTIFVLTMSSSPPVTTERGARIRAEPSIGLGSAGLVIRASL